MTLTYKVLTIRTLEAILDGEASYWRLSNPLLCKSTVRGSMVIAVHDAFLRDRLDAVLHWCPVDSGGVRLGYRNLPVSLAVDDVLQDRASLGQLLALSARSRELANRMESGEAPTSEELVRVNAAALRPLLSSAATIRDWVYEVRVGASAPLALDGVAWLLCPNTALRSIRRMIGRRSKVSLVAYNPRWTLDGVERHLLRGRL